MDDVVRAVEVGGVKVETEVDDEEEGDATLDRLHEGHTWHVASERNTCHTASGGTRGKRGVPTESISMSIGVNGCRIKPLAVILTEKP